MKQRESDGRGTSKKCRLSDRANLAEITESAESGVGGKKGEKSDGAISAACASQVDRGFLYSLSSETIHLGGSIESDRTVLCSGLHGPVNNDSSTRFRPYRCLSDPLENIN